MTILRSGRCLQQIEKQIDVMSKFNTLISHGYISSKNLCNFNFFNLYTDLDNKPCDFINTGISIIRTCRSKLVAIILNYMALSVIPIISRPDTNPFNWISEGSLSCELGGLQITCCREHYAMERHRRLVSSQNTYCKHIVYVLEEIQLS